MEKHFSYASRFDCDRSELFDWHEKKGAFERLIPPWRSVRIIDSDFRISDGAKTTFSVGVGLFKVKWEA